MTVDRHRELIASEARLRQAEDVPVVPVPGHPCQVDGCSADTRLGTLQGGGPMLCQGFGMDGPCIARWLTEADPRGYPAWCAAQ